MKQLHSKYERVFNVRQLKRRSRILLGRNRGPVFEQLKILKRVNEGTLSDLYDFNEEFVPEISRCSFGQAFVAR